MLNFLRFKTWRHPLIKAQSAHSSSSAISKGKELQFLFPAKAEAFSRLLNRRPGSSQLMQVHSRVVTQALSHPHPSLLDSLIHCYLYLEDLSSARALFDSHPSPSTLVWNILIKAYSKLKHSQEPITLLRQMLNLNPPSSAFPDVYTFNSVITSCSHQVSLFSGLAVHGMLIRNGFHSCLYIGNALINCYRAFQKIEDAQQVFDEMPQQDVFSWTSLLLGYAENREMGRANAIFWTMPTRNEVSWAVMISGFVRGGLYIQALEYFQKMMHNGNVKPNEAIIVSSLSACAHLGALDQGNWINSIIDNNNRILRSSNISSALINMYAKCGKIDLASRIFNQTLRRDVLIYTSMITGFSIHGLGNDSLLVFNQMLEEDVKPNDVSVLALLNGCSHSGLVNEGESIFLNMENKWGIVPKIEHYGSYVDLLSRSGHLERAFETIKKMKMDPDKAIWRALLNGCRIHRDAAKAECVINHITRFYPSFGSSGGEVLVSNLYASLGIWEKVEEVRRVMLCSSGSPGCSWIEVNGIINEFRVGDKLHPQISEIRRELGKILIRLSEEEGYIATTRLVSFDVNEEEKEEAMAWHSEKLAVTLGVMNTPSGGSIRIVKNLRTCEDCHLFLKAISSVFNIEIVVRDRTRFHSFMLGKCSCNDYW